MRISVIAAVLSLTACGAILNGGPANVPMSTNPPGAEIWIDGTNRGMTPATLSLAKNRPYTVTFRRGGFQDTSVEIGRRVSGGYVVLDVLFGLLPVIVDAATGSWYVLDTSNVNVNLLPNGATSGQLTPEQLGALRLGVGVESFITSAP
jgi:hypothetical protein